MEVPYSGNILREKIFAKASTRVLHENFAGFYFCQCGKGRHIHCVIINTRGKFVDKIFANGSKWRNWQKFSPGEKYPLYSMR